ncbi:IS21 family transposase [Nannocystis exedens]|uniref:IS21 family transposase n=1 Tax=Nannocystis exedens TaxID=54 RepID=UPI000BBA02A9|nr:IS21 family transposase [Nannocystis exedens]PCC67217.1 integrase [Nannocystis exedens]PCC68161.1 integrase [Nannocystis exedens]PCC69290.1 integrase [Nannocystis exedens]PCC73473.1 integrase [Nannocystis exedens]PCC73541.1 integrase [Nannocystis exedens]
MTTSALTRANVLRLFHAEGWRIGTIAAQLGLHHGTVRRILQHNGVKLPAPKRRTKVDPYRAFIRETLEKYPKLRATRILQMVRTRGYTGQISRLREVVRELRPRRAEAYLRLATLPGEQAQVDWADFGKVQVGRATRKLMAFVMVLSWSRALFVRFFYDARMPSFLAGHVHAFAYFGGAARVVLYDNLKSAVLERQGDAIRLHPTLVEFAGHYRYEPRPVAPRRGNEKGRVERAIRYLRDAFFAGRTFVGLDDLNAQVLAFCQTLAMQRLWPDDRARTVESAFAEERPLLLVASGEPFPCAEQQPVRAGKTPYVRFDRNDYSIPHTHVCKELVVVADAERVRVVDGTHVIAEHARCYGAGEVLEDRSHIDALWSEKTGARTHRELDRLRRAVPRSQDFLRALAERGEPLARATRQLEELLDAHGACLLEQAIDDALARELLYIPALRKAIEQLAPPGHREAPELPTRLRAIVVRPHDLRTYDALTAEENDDGDEDT